MINSRAFLHLMGLVIIAQGLAYFNAQQMDLHPIFDSTMWRLVLVYASGLVLIVWATRFARRYLSDDVELIPYSFDPEDISMTLTMIGHDFSVRWQRLELINSEMRKAVDNLEKYRDRASVDRVKFLTAILRQTCNEAEGLLQLYVSLVGGEDVN